jgi:hypothetical protein
MEKQYHEVITNAVTGEVTEIIRDWTPEELAQHAAATVVAQPTKEELLAKLEELQTQIAQLGK